MPGKLILASKKEKVVPNIKLPDKESDMKMGIYEVTKRLVSTKTFVGLPNIYINTSQNPEINKVGSINVVFDMNAPHSYESLVNHVSNEFVYNNTKTFCDMEYNKNKLPINRSTTEDGIEILVNNVFVTGYYLPDIDSFVVGNWVWHKHYSEIVVPYIWPQIISELQKLGYNP